MEYQNLYFKAMRESFEKVAADVSLARHIRTFTGNYIDVFDPKPESIWIEDIAHALSQMPRFGGHLKEFYSVAEHCINCCNMARDEHKLSALLHDSTEALLIDVPRPIKKHLNGYKEIEENLLSVIAKRFNFQYPLPLEVKTIDEIMLQVEWDSLMIGHAQHDIRRYSMKEAEAEFIELYRSITNDYTQCAHAKK